MMACVLALLCVAPARAEFHKPVPEELAMTEDPKWPGAAAIYLDVEDETHYSIGYHSFYTRIKILKSSALDLASVHVPYNRAWSEIKEIRGRTIHPDGSVTLMKVKPEDLVLVKGADEEYKSIEFALPGAEVGCILEYSYQVRGRGMYPYWEVQKRYPVRKAHYLTTDFPQHFASWKVLPKGADVQYDKMGNLSLDVADVPPIPQEEWMPPYDNLQYHAAFVWVSQPTLEVFWADKAKEWSKDVDAFAETSKTIKHAVKEMSIEGADETAKARRIYQAVQGIDNVAFSREREKSELKQARLRSIKSAEDVWTERRGGPNQIALLYLALARAAGLHAYAIKVADRKLAIFSALYPETAQLNDILIAVTLDGKTMMLDPGEKMCPFGMLHWRHAVAGGMRQPESGKEALVMTPESDYTKNSVVRMAQMLLQADGSASGTLHITMQGQVAMQWRQYALRVDADEWNREMQKQIDDELPEGLKSTVEQVLAISDAEEKLTVTMRVCGQVGEAMGKRLILPAEIFAIRGKAPFVSNEKRESPVDMHYGDVVADQLNYTLPDGMTLEGTPGEVKERWSGHAKFDTRIVAAAGKVTVARALSRSFTFAEAKEYAELRGFYQKVAASDQQQLVLSVVAPKGN